MKSFGSPSLKLQSSTVEMNGTTGIFIYHLVLRFCSRTLCTTQRWTRVNGTSSPRSESSHSVCEVLAGDMTKPPSLYCNEQPSQEVKCCKTQLEIVSLGIHPKDGIWSLHHLDCYLDIWSRARTYQKFYLTNLTSKS